MAKLPDPGPSPIVDLWMPEDLPDAWVPRQGWGTLQTLIGSFGADSHHPDAPYAGISSLLMLLLAGSAALGRRRPRFVEIGTRFGDSLMGLLHAAEQYDGHVTSIDIEPQCEQVVRERVATLARGRHWLDRWTFVCGDSRTVPWVEHTDLLYVDGNHDYDAVCEDMARHGTAVRAGGLVVLDDYHVGFPGKQRWVQERWQELQPLVLGPWIVIRKQPWHNATFTRSYPGDGWRWAVEGGRR